MNDLQIGIILGAIALPTVAYYITKTRQISQENRVFTTLFLAAITLTFCIVFPVKNEKIIVQPESVFFNSNYAVAIYKDIIITSNIAQIVNQATKENVVIVKERKINSFNFWIPSLSKNVIEINTTTVTQEKENE